MADDFAGSSATTATLTTPLFDWSDVNASSPAVTMAGGTIETAGDRDWFRISLYGTITYTFQVRGASTPPGLDGGTLTNPLLVLRNESGAVLASNDDGGVGYNSTLTYYASFGQTVYLDVGDSTANGVGSYTVLAMIGNATNATQNDTTGASSFSSFESPVRGLEGDDVITGMRSNQTLIGDSGNDTLLAGGENVNLLGGDGNDALYGNQGSGFGGSRLYGGNGNDILDPGIGTGAWMYGGAGNDTIYWSPVADLAAVLGGADFDTLILSYATGVQTSFNLSAHQFERAILDRVDSGNTQTWSRALYLYNAAWQNTSLEITYDNSSREIITYDVAGNQAWSRFYNFYNSSGQYFAQRILYDTGAIDTQYTDYTNSQPWSSYIDFVNTTGAQYARRYFQDAGNYDTIYYDSTGAQPWFQQTEFRQADGDMHTRQTNYDNGQYLNEYFDVDNAQSWARYEELFNAIGARVYQRGTYDSGATWVV